VQRAHAFSAYGILGHIQFPPKANGFVSIQDFIKWTIMNVAERLVKETRTNGSIGFNHGRNPWGVAAIRGKVASTR